MKHSILAICLCIQAFFAPAALAVSPLDSYSANFDTMTQCLWLTQSSDDTQSEQTAPEEEEEPDCD